MSLYKQIDVPVEFEVIGELLHTVVLCNLPLDDSPERTLVTTVENRSTDRLLHIYCNGKRIHRKRIFKDKPIMVESISLLDAISMEYQMKMRD